VTVPPLRHRVDDVRDLVPALLERHGNPRRAGCTPEALQTLLRCKWPRNVAQLEEALRSALARRGSGPIRLEDLPADCHAVTRRVLTRWEWIERDAIVSALIEAEGNRARAAARLGISRATIYRKIGAFGIHGLRGAQAPRKAPRVVRALPSVDAFMGRRGAGAPRRPDAPRRAGRRRRRRG
jgi:sigma-54 dependent transcriptional regulator, acetoin dehydrogenase operon transcriptional activator AcoR